MIRLTARTLKLSLPIALGLAVCALIAQNQAPKLDPSVLTAAPTVPQMIVDSDGTLHFGPRTVPPPALESPEARAAYTRQMMQKAQASAAKGGMASARTLDGVPEPPTAGTASKPR